MACSKCVILRIHDLPARSRHGSLPAVTRKSFVVEAGRPGAGGRLAPIGPVRPLARKGAQENVSAANALSRCFATFVPIWCEGADASCEDPVVRERDRFLAAAVAVMLAAMVASAPAQGPMPLAFAKTSDAIKLGAERTDIPLVAAEGNGPARDAAPLAARVKSLAPDNRVYLRLQGLAAEGDPGVSYNVYLNLPPNRAPQGASDPHYLGTFSFFDAEGGERSRAINITAQLKRLAAQGKLGPDATLTLVPAGEFVARAAPRIGRVVITTQ